MSARRHSVLYASRHFHGHDGYQYPLNPVTGTDPLGLKVTFKGDEEQQKAMKEAYESVRKTKHGQEMIEKMELSDH